MMDAEKSKIFMECWKVVNGILIEWANFIKPIWKTINSPYEEYYTLEMRPLNYNYVGLN